MGDWKNRLIAVLVPLPSLIFFLFFLNRFKSVASISNSVNFWGWCARHPLLLANLLFFINIDVIFWLIGLIQSKHWLIDLYWTVIPPMLAGYYAFFPLAVSDPVRSAVVIALTCLWSIRLTHSYFRREQWRWGEREDWRFHDLRKKHGGNWWWISFFAVYLSQQVFLIGICLPVYAVHSSEKGWDGWDAIASGICVGGIAIAGFADTQLYRYMEKNRSLETIGEAPVLNLETGLWRYSRHPNYLGEQLWWWGLALFGWNCGQGWTAIGAALNSLCLAYVTVLVERRMLEKKSRAEAYRLYQRTTSVWIPWFKNSKIKSH
ncbi:3-oxo-5-alpha-steroid 4-dehydrogenase (DUF1295) [Wolffia australiana]